MPEKTEKRPRRASASRPGEASADIFSALGLGDSVEEQKDVLSHVRSIYNAMAPVNFRSSTQRRDLRQAIVDRMDRMPPAVQEISSDKAEELLYRLVQLLRTTWGGGSAMEWPDSEPEAKKHKKEPESTSGAFGDSVEQIRRVIDQRAQLDDYARNQLSKWKARRTEEAEAERASMQETLRRARNKMVRRATHTIWRELRREEQELVEKAIKCKATLKARRRLWRELERGGLEKERDVVQTAEMETREQAQKIGDSKKEAEQEPAEEPEQRGYRGVTEESREEMQGRLELIKQNLPRGVGNTVLEVQEKLRLELDSWEETIKPSISSYTRILELELWEMWQELELAMQDEVLRSRRLLNGKPDIEDHVWKFLRENPDFRDRLGLRMLERLGHRKYSLGPAVNGFGEEAQRGRDDIGLKISNGQEDLLCYLNERHGGHIQQQLQKHQGIERQGPLQGLSLDAVQFVQDAERRIQHEINVWLEQLRERWQQRIVTTMRKLAHQSLREIPLHVDEELLRRTRWRGPVPKDYIHPVELGMIPDTELKVISAIRTRASTSLNLAQLTTSPPVYGPRCTWIKSSSLQLKTLLKILPEQLKFNRAEEALWLSHRALEDIDPTRLSEVQSNERILTHLNFSAVIQQYIDEFYPEYPGLRSGSSIPKSIRQPRFTLIARRRLVPGKPEYSITSKNSINVHLISNGIRPTIGGGRFSIEYSNTQTDP